MQDILATNVSLLNTYQDTDLDAAQLRRHTYEALGTDILSACQGGT